MRVNRTCSPYTCDSAGVFSVPREKKKRGEREHGEQVAGKQQRGHRRLSRNSRATSLPDASPRNVSIRKLGRNVRVRRGYVLAAIVAVGERSGNEREDAGAERGRKEVDANEEISRLTDELFPRRDPLSPRTLNVVINDPGDALGGTLSLPLC